MVRETKCDKCGKALEMMERDDLFLNYSVVLGDIDYDFCSEECVTDFFRERLEKSYVDKKNVGRNIYYTIKEFKNKLDFKDLLLIQELISKELLLRIKKVRHEE